MFRLRPTLYPKEGASGWPAELLRGVRAPRSYEGSIKEIPKEEGEAAERGLKMSARRGHNEGPIIKREDGRWEAGHYGITTGRLTMTISGEKEGNDVEAWK